ncbi:D-alanyl-D-alanine carboxypeptidase [Streptomyces sp. NPDC052676]|uniref:D-alanyl-D-alanine carboxypeptidase n=1 Tax=Streptomyces sp. NPDC052676 TaxID=3154953 RepID=UPI00342BD48D
MEEASVAGESPDRSKQRESSAEPTSGSAGPVPEARSEAADPRLSVARAAVDTATRVLSAKDLAQAREGAAGAAGEKDEEGLRAAVAAWVRSADETPSGDAPSGDAPSDGGEPSKRSGGTGEAEKGEKAEKADGAEESGATGKADASEKTGEAGKGDRTREVSETDQAEKAGAGEKTGAASGTGQAEKAGVAEKTDEVGDTGRAEGAEEETEAAAEGDAEGDAQGEDAAEPEGVSGAGQGGSAKAGATAADDASAQGDASDAEGPEDTDTDDTEDSESDGAAGDAPSDVAAKADAVAEEADAKADEADAKAGEAKAASGAVDAKGAAPDAGKGSVDQPTTVFKAVRPPKPAVDQPTTMLKLGDVAKAKPAEKADKADEADKGAKGDEGGATGKDAERTSKFVALKPLDDPAARKPRPAMPAKPAGPGEPAEPAKPAEPAASAASAAPAPAPAPADVTAAVPQIGPERTTQQPLPPKPPLDLLAELTNTPPPPQTPLRTAVRRVKIWTPLVLLLVIVFAVVQSFRPLPAPTLQLTAQDSYTFDGSKVDIPWPENGQAALDVQGIGTFGSSGEQKPVPIASVAKVMTAYIILRDHPLKSGEEGPMIKIDQVAEDQSQAGQESTVNVYAGDQISEREAIEGILIASANNVARLLARWDAGSEKDFVAKMNATAKDLGMTNTTYTDPSGLNDTTVSTAVDQVKLAKAAMTQPAFREVAAMMSYDDYKGVNHPNWNQLVGSNGVVGIKTGTTTSALGNLVFAAKKEIGGETHTIVGAVVRQPAGGADNTILGAALHQSDLLIRAAQGALESATILKKGDVVGYVDDGLGGRTPVVATEDVTAVGWPGLEVKVSFAADELPHTAKAGTKVGTLTVGDGAVAGAVKVPVALQRDLVEPGFMDKVTRIA